MSQVDLWKRYGSVALLMVIPGRAVVDTRLSDGAKITLCVLASFQNGQAECWPTLEVLAERRGVSTRTVKRQLAELRECGYVVSQRRRFRDGSFGVNRFRILFEPPLPDGMVEEEIGLEEMWEAEAGSNASGHQGTELSLGAPTGHQVSPTRGRQLAPTTGQQVAPPVEPVTRTGQENQTGAHARARGEAAAPKPKAKRKAPEAPGRLPEGWEPTPAVRLFAEGAGLPVERVVREFRSYWQQRGDLKTPRGWEQAFANRVRMLHGQGLDSGKKLPPLPDWAECATVSPAPDGKPQAGGDLTSREREILRLCDQADERNVRLEKLPRWFGSHGSRPPLGECMDEADRWIRAACERLQRPLPPFVLPDITPPTVAGEHHA